MKVKLDYVSAATDDHGYVKSSNAFCGVFSLGLPLGTQYAASKNYPTDDEGLEDMKSSLENMVYECLGGISGIGGIILAADPKNLMTEDLMNAGSIIKNIAQLGIEAQDHIEGIEMDINRRRKASTTKPEPLAEEV